MENTFLGSWLIECKLILDGNEAWQMCVIVLSFSSFFFLRKGEEFN